MLRPSVHISTVFSWFLLALLGSGWAQAEVVHTLEQSFYPDGADTLELDLSIGDITIEGTDGRDVEVHVTLECGREKLDRCTERARALYLRPRIRREILKVDLEGTARRRLQGISAHMKVRVPRHMALELDLRGGAVAISGMQSHLEVDSGAGDIDIVTTRQQVRSVKIDVGVGSADLWLPEGHIEGRGFPRSVTWNGSGRSEIEVDVGTGDVAVRLE